MFMYYINGGTASLMMFTDMNDKAYLVNFPNQNSMEIIVSLLYPVHYKRYNLFIKTPL